MGVAMKAIVKLPNIWSKESYLAFLNFSHTYISIEKREKYELVHLLEYLAIEHLFSTTIFNAEDLNDGVEVLKRLRDAIQDTDQDLLSSLESESDMVGYDYTLIKDIMTTSVEFIDMDEWAVLLTRYLSATDTQRYERVDRRVADIFEWYDVSDVHVETNYEISVEDYEWTGEVIGICKHRIEVTI